MDEKLLSISEAAKLIGVCENTLRDWDIEGKFKAQRTYGGHRRYSLEQIREYVDKHQSEPSQKSFRLDKGIDEIIGRWEETEYLEGLSRKEKRQLAPLLETCKAYQSTQTGEARFSTNQMLWLTQQGWLRCRFKKMMSVQPMIGPADLVFYRDEYKFADAAIVAKTNQYHFKAFVDAEFEKVKDVYADAIAHGLELHILCNLPRCDLDSLLNIDIALSEIYDYIIGPEQYMETLRKNEEKCSGVDLIDFYPVLDPDSLKPIVVGGRYSKDNLSTPIFAPYNIVFTGPMLVGKMMSLMMRTGWFHNEPSKDKA